jgi:glycosyltransferase involved in cell wall biosynthesis
MSVDLVIPAYNEAAALPVLFANLAAQVDAAGRPLPRGSWRLVLVDNASTDGTREVAAQMAEDPRHPETVVLMEPEKGVVPARIRGSDSVLRPAERRRFPFVVHADADNLFPPTFIDDVRRQLAAGGVDVVSRVGYRSAAFWRRVPAVARRQHSEIGTLHFDDETIRELGFDDSGHREDDGAPFTRRIFEDFRFVPHQCGLAMTKEVFARAGGYRREFRPDGTELLGEARNLLYRLARIGARLDYVASPGIVLNPRRLLSEPETLWAGRSYCGAMNDPRQIGDDAYAALDRLAPQLEFGVMRRNLIQRFILDPCLARPALLAANRRYFGAVYEPIRAAVARLHATARTAMYLDVRPVSDELVDRHQGAILEGLRQLAGRSTTAVRRARRPAATNISIRA